MHIHVCSREQEYNVRRLLEEQHKYCELIVPWYPTSFLLRLVGIGPWYNKDWVMFWFFAAGQVGERFVAEWQGESLSLTEILEGLCQLTVFVKRADVRDFLYVFCRDADCVPVHQGVKTLFWIIKHSTIVNIDLFSGGTLESKECGYLSCSFRSYLRYCWH